MVTQRTITYASFISRRSFDQKPRLTRAVSAPFQVFSKPNSVRKGFNDLFGGVSEAAHSYKNLLEGNKSVSQRIEISFDRQMPHLNRTEDLQMCATPSEAYPLCFIHREYELCLVNKVGSCS